MNGDSTPAKGLIADTPLEERPREKALRQGLKSLTDAELMALIFATGIKGKGIVALCNEILDEYRGHLSAVTQMDAREFMKRHKGIGPAKALTFMAALELGGRAARDAVETADPQMTTSKLAYEYMKMRMDELDHEEFWVLMLKRNLRPLREFKAGQGGLSETVVDIRLLIREALMAKTSAMILFHNHPSGQLSPSPQDIMLTRRIKDAAAYFDIRVLDHIIVAPTGYYSFNDNGKL